ncbi:MAG: N-acetylmuramoyl-L-alanine amidase [Clostridiales bacterium]|jgi:N-acetylmuramoyl-L-alanine amidase|nr:N-acetylmuramoyl-L-alanine amidase [Clostridiales bacterium]
MKKTWLCCFLTTLFCLTFACQALSAAAEKLPLTGQLIGIDAGHQRKGNAALEPVAPGSKEKKPKVSSGTRGSFTGVPEYQVNLDVALLLRDKLEALGAEALMVRVDNDVNISNAERAVMMNEAKVDLIVRIHADGSSSSSVNGASMLVPSPKSTPDIAAESRAAGEIILKNFIEATGAKDRGIDPRSDMTGFNWSKVPVCLIEMGFMTNKREDQLLTSQEYQEKCAQGLADGVAAWVKSKADSNP